MLNDVHKTVDDLIGRVAWKYKNDKILLTYEDLRSELWSYYLTNFEENESRGAYLNVCFTRYAIDIIRKYSRRSHTEIKDTHEIQEVDEAYSFLAISEILELFSDEPLCQDYILSKLMQLNLHKYLPMKHRDRALQLDKIIGDTERTMSQALIGDGSNNYKWRNMKQITKHALRKFIKEMR